MLKKYFLLVSLVFSLSLNAQPEFNDDSEAGDKTAYRCFIDLTKVHDDKLTVIIYTPKTVSEITEFRMPRIVPGTYSIYDFGRFISNFKAFDSKGIELPVSKSDVNGWLIQNAATLTMVTYDVEDSWDTAIKSNYIFEPAGTNIDDGKNFIINTFGYFGYLKDKKEIPYELYVTKPDGFYASTGAAGLKSGAKNDVLNYTNYNDLADSPIMYCKPDTTWLNIGGSQVLVSVYSPNKKADSKGISKNIKQILDAQKEYLGGTLPVKKYAFLINLYSGYFTRSGSYGALEHSYSSFYFLPEMDNTSLSQTVKDISAHEFFHIVTPLNIHSEEIQYFDYDNPKMSRHLWLYEGLTEYSATLVQIKYGLLDLDGYVDVLHEKISNAARYNDSLPFTVMSLGCLDKYVNQYQNVYEKGALIGMCIDIKLRSLSDGKYGIQNLMMDLAKKYGKDKPFKDAELFDEITKLTYPEIGIFLKTYVSGTQPLPLNEVLEMVGITYDKQPVHQELFIGSNVVKASAEGIYVDDYSGLYDGPNCDLSLGDAILAVDGRKISATNAANMFEYMKKQAGLAKNLRLKVKHANGRNSIEEITCPASLRDIADNGFTLKLKPNPTPAQLALRKAWIGQ